MRRKSSASFAAEYRSAFNPSKVIEIKALSMRTRLKTTFVYGIIKPQEGGGMIE